MSMIGDIVARVCGLAPAIDRFGIVVGNKM
jgi:hypothetical protein